MSYARLSANTISPSYHSIDTEHGRNSSPDFQPAESSRHRKIPTPLGRSVGVGIETGWKLGGAASIYLGAAVFGNRKDTQEKSWSVAEGLTVATLPFAGMAVGAAMGAGMYLVKEGLRTALQAQHQATAIRHADSQPAYSAADAHPNALPANVPDVSSLRPAKPAEPS